MCWLMVDLYSFAKNVRVRPLCCVVFVRGIVESGNRGIDGFFTQNYEF